MSFAEIQGRLITGTGWTFEELDAQPFSRCTELFEYWEADPQLHLMVKAYLGYETSPKANMMELAQAVKVVGGGKRAQKLSTAPKEDQERFAQLKKQSKETKRAR